MKRIIFKLLSVALFVSCSAHVFANNGASVTPVRPARCSEYEAARSVSTSHIKNVHAEGSYIYVDVISRFGKCDQSGLFVDDISRNLITAHVRNNSRRTPDAIVEIIERKAHQITTRVKIPMNGVKQMASYRLSFVRKFFYEYAWKLVVTYDEANGVKAKIGI